MGSTAVNESLDESAMDAGVNRRMVRITTGLTSAVVAALPGCGRPSPCLPLLSLPYTHYSLLAVGHLRRRFMEHCPWEEATPRLRDPNRVPGPSTLLFSVKRSPVSLTGWRTGVPADRKLGLYATSWVQLGVLTPSRE